MTAVITALKEIINMGWDKKDRYLYGFPVCEERTDPVDTRMDPERLEDGCQKTCKKQGTLDRDERALRRLLSGVALGKRPFGRQIQNYSVISLVGIRKDEIRLKHISNFLLGIFGSKYSFSSVS